MKKKAIRAPGPLEMASGILKNLEKIQRGEWPGSNRWVDLIGDAAVSTVKGSDTGLWETGIRRGGEHWVVVEQYPDVDAAEKGHAEWVLAMGNNPNQELTDIFKEAYREIGLDP